MRDEKHEAFYHGTAWRKARAAYISMRQSVDGGVCEVCHELPGKIVHHKKHLNAMNVSDPDIALSFDNLQYVCKNCHDRIHGYANTQTVKSRVWFDAAGNMHMYEDE